MASDPPENTNFSTSSTSTNAAVINTNPKDPASPYFLNKNDGLGTLLTNHLLTTENYHSKAQTVRRALRIKKKLGFIDGSLCELDNPSDPIYETWLECNDMVINWLQNAMSLELKDIVVYVETNMSCGQI